MSIQPRQPFVVEVVVLHEWDGGLRGFHRVDRMDDFRLMADGVFHLHVLAHDDVGGEPHSQADDKPESHLSDHLVFPFQTVLVVVFKLAVVIEESDGAHPDRGDKHQYHVDI